MKESNETVDHYKDVADKAFMDFGITVESTEQMIDMHFTKFAKFLEGKNIGELRAFRVLMQMHLDKADMLGKSLIDDKALKYKSKVEVVKIASVFSIAVRISDRMGYIDYLLKKNAIK